MGISRPTAVERCHALPAHVDLAAEALDVAAALVLLDGLAAVRTGATAAGALLHP